MGLMRTLFAAGGKGARAAMALELADLRARAAALDKSQEVIEFTLDGKIVHANDSGWRPGTPGRRDAHCGKSNKHSRGAV